MKKNLITSFSIIVSVFFMFGCYEKPKNQKISSSGKTAEMIVVINDVHWESEIGDSIRKCFKREIGGLATVEPQFDLVQMPESAFGKLFQTHRNILIVGIDKQLTKPKLEVSKDVWAQPQLVTRLMAPTRESLLETFEGRKNKLFELYMETERRRISKAFEKDANLNIMPILKSKYLVKMAVPSAYYVGKSNDDFLWIRKKTRKFDHEVMIYTYPYTDTIAFNPEHIIDYRNQITKANIPGMVDSSYMIVSTAYPPMFKVVEINGCYAIETRGLWDVEGDFMGGPFLNYTILDEKNNRIVTVDGSVYSPNKEKRDHIIQLESIFYSIEFIEKEPGQK
ncbi:MAG: DUF4837 family protein [Saprospiraceae bacterium]|nr:DUF4837 family protein [Saprospiraceae bacterium]